MDEKRYDALEQALADLSAGEELINIMEANPEIKAEIETAQWIQSLSLSTIPLVVVQRSRTRVLSRAMQLSQETKSRGVIFRRIPRIAYALVLALILLLSWNGLVFASAQALPGDQLYPAKLTLEKLRLGLALNPQVHREVEAEYQARRVDEVARLLALGRVEFIQFMGVVENQWDDHWVVEGIEVRLLPETIILGDILTGMDVEVEGATQPEGWVQASEIHLQNFSFTGMVEVISKGAWTISGREVLITSASQIDSDIQVGDTVNVEVSSDDFGTLTARSITGYTAGDDGLQATETPESPEDAHEKNVDNENGDEDGIEEEKQRPEPDEPDETDEPGESDEQDETDKTDQPEETDEPDEQDKKDKDDSSDSNDEDDRGDSDDSDDKNDEIDKPGD